MGLREFAEAKNDDGSWVYPQVRADLKMMKDNKASELFHVENKIAFCESRVDSLSIELMVANVSCQRKWFDNLESGIIAGAILVILSGWAMGQVSK